METDSDLEKGRIGDKLPDARADRAGKNLKNLDYWIIADEPIPGIPPDFYI